MEPEGTSIKDLLCRSLVFLSVPMVLVSTSVSMAVFSFMSRKVEEGESWDTLINWLWHLMVQDPLYTMVLPFILCIGMTLVIVRPRGK